MTTDQIKQFIITVYGRDVYRGSLPCYDRYSVFCIYLVKTAGDCDRSKFDNCFNSLVNDKILVYEEQGNSYHINFDFCKEPDIIGRYKYLQEILHEL